jgi:hypothetical protein
MCKSTLRLFGSMLTSIIWALHLGQAGRANGAGGMGRANLAAHRCSNFLSRSTGIVLMIRTPGFAILPRCYRFNAHRALKVPKAPEGTIASAAAR